jgi:hypothetical protein
MNTNSIGNNFNNLVKIDNTNSNRTENKRNFLYNVISSDVKPNEAEFKILSARLSKKAFGASSKIGRVKDQIVKSIDNLIKNSSKESKLNNFNTNPKPNTNLNVNVGIKINQNGNNNNNLLLDSSGIPVKFNITNKQKPKNNINTVHTKIKDPIENKNDAANNNMEINENNQNEAEMLKNINFGDLIKINKNTKTSKIKGIQIKNFNQVLQNNFITKAVFSKTERIVKSNKKN